MKLYTVSLGGSYNNQDRYFVTGGEDGIVLVVLDGASAIQPKRMDAGVYAEFLGDSIANRLDNQPDVIIPDAVAGAISHTADQLGLIPDRSPSSTVSVLRTRPGAVDLYVLGDSPIHYGNGVDHDVLIDDRLDSVARQLRALYVSRLRAGHGFDDRHRRTLAELQRAQRRVRNRPGGYWIAETDPAAAHHGLSLTLHPDELTWAVLATDGAADPIDHFGDSWYRLAHLDLEDYLPLLDELHAWEATVDPGGAQLPRAKRHDDKTLVAINYLVQEN